MVAFKLKSHTLPPFDEAPMMHKFHFEVLDRTLQDIMGNEVQFGGKIFVMGGDFRQTLPIVKHGSQNQIFLLLYVHRRYGKQLRYYL